MKLYLIIFFSILCFTALAQGSDIITVKHSHTSKSARTTIATISVGFIDYYRSHPDYSLPAGFQKNNTTGFAPVNGKLEYGLTGNLSLMATVYYDNFSYNYNQLYTGNGIIFSRYKVNTFTLIGAGLSFCYYFDKYIHVKNLEPFLALGVSLNNIHQSAIPQGDTAISSIGHIASPCLKAGIRYLLGSSKNAGVYFDLGYDKQSIFDIGLSCKLYRKKGRHLRL